jgi:hypothetical protein
MRVYDTCGIEAFVTGGMKSNVKDVARLRARALQVLGFGTVSLACKSASDTDGLVVVPMLEAPVSASVVVPDAGQEASVATRSLREPHPPNNQKCGNRDVQCIAALASAPTYPYPHPYERCDPNPLGETGQLSARETDDHRVSEPDVCCYVSFGQCNGRVRVRSVVGRPLRDATGEPIVASLAGTVRTERAAWWARCAVLEHASVAEFARLTLVLLSLGAPSELVEAAQQAGLDEIAHARACFVLSTRFGGMQLDAGRLAVDRSEAGASVAALTWDTLRDGCCGESAGALELRAVARQETDPMMADMIDRMASDEERHAELAWRILRFCVATDSTAAIPVIRAFLDALEHSPIADDLVRPCAEALVSASAQWQRGGSCAPEA